MTDQEHSQALREAQEERSRLLSLTHTPGYKWFMGIVESQITMRRNEFELTPLEKMDEVLKEQFLKGEIHAFSVCKMLVTARVEELEDAIEELERELEI